MTPTFAEIAVPENAALLLNTLYENGINAYPVGGCVRDRLCGREPGDWDIAAETRPDKLCRALDDFSYSTEGIKFGTVRVHFDSECIEVTCCRRETGYADCRRPDRVDFTEDIRDDLARRDFTVNAMAFNPRGGEIIDPYGGMNDIEKGVIRCVGDARIRFGEDALRILRALRFASVLGYTIDADTENAIHEMKNTLSALSGERVLSEIKKLLCGDNVFEILTDYSDVICTVIPELQKSVGFDQHNPHHIYTVYEHISRTVAALPKDPILRLTMLFHDMAKPYVCTVDDEGIFHFRGHPEEGAKMAEAILKRLKADRDTIEKVCFFIKYHDVRPAATKSDIHRYMLKTGYEGAKELLFIRRADLSAQSPEYHSGFAYIDQCEELIEELHREEAALKISDLKINGSDLIALGVKEGPEIGEILNRLLEEVADGKTVNGREALIKRYSGIFN